MIKCLIVCAKERVSFMKFVDVCFKSTVLGTMDTYKCETNLYGISNSCEEFLIATFVYGRDGLTTEKYNPSVKQSELYQINNILINKYNDYCLSKVKVK